MVKKVIDYRKCGISWKRVRLKEIMRRNSETREKLQKGEEKRGKRGRGKKRRERKKKEDRKFLVPGRSKNLLPPFTRAFSLA